jgi:hypothetical protein
MQIKRERLHAVRRVIFLFLKASIGDLITMLSSSIQNSEGGGDGDGGDSLDPRVLGIGMNKRPANGKRGKTMIKISLYQSKIK